MFVRIVVNGIFFEQFERRRSAFDSFFDNCDNSAEKSQHVTTVYESNDVNAGVHMTACVRNVDVNDALHMTDGLLLRMWTNQRKPANQLHNAFCGVED